MYGQVSSPLIRRVTQVDTRFIKELEFEPRVASEFDFQLDCDSVLQAIHAMDFFELKGTSHIAYLYPLSLLQTTVL